MTERAASLDRRRFLAAAGTLAGLVVAGRRPSSLRAATRLAAYPFTLGVASGEPQSDGMVLWTRLAPDPLNGGGMPATTVEVEWLVASDERMRRVVRRGVERATPELAHSVHVVVDGLDPNSPYWYQFVAAGEVSPIGRTRTAPAPGAAVKRFRFAVASCQEWQSGFYAAYRHLAADDLDLVVHLGDYIYEHGIFPGTVRSHNGPACATLDDYRSRYALYKSDPDLQAAHAACPWIVTWDDHEVANDYAGTDAADEEPVEAFLQRRAAAYQAYYEHLPLRRSALPAGPRMSLYRRFAFGDLIALNVLDTRQFRTPPACGRGVTRSCDAATNPARTMTGAAQERWLLDGLGVSRARWNVLAQQTMMAPLAVPLGPLDFRFADAWDEYPAARERILTALTDGPSNPIVLSGDYHSSWVNDLAPDAADDATPIVATEFVGPSITSACVADPVFRRAVSANPHVRFYDGERHGYLRCTVEPTLWRTDIQTVDSVLDPDAPLATLATFVVEDGRPGGFRA